MAREPLDTWCYVIKKHGRIVHVGVTTDPARREREHQRTFGDNVRMELIGTGPYTHSVAKAWEDEQRRLRYPTGP
ncbi:MAG: hypothetical protein OXK79_07165 [Chloroflexota bacterium]|nr:hypothetical protein [Chloroflexota bacterium]